jgi:hypothetical protein
MGRILLLLAGAAVLALPAAAAARPRAGAVPRGFLVVHDATADEGVTGKPVATVVVQGFVIGRIAQEGAVEVYRLSGSGVPQASGVDLARGTVNWRGVFGTRFTGSGFRFRAAGGAGGVWRVVVYGAGVSLYAGGQGTVVLHGSAAYPEDDGEYSFNGERFASLPPGVIKGKLEAK